MTKGKDSLALTKILYLMTRLDEVLGYKISHDPCPTDVQV